MLRISIIASIYYKKLFLNFKRIIKLPQFSIIIFILDILTCVFRAQVIIFLLIFIYEFTTYNVVLFKALLDNKN